MNEQFHVVRCKLRGNVFPGLVYRKDTTDDLIPEASEVECFVTYPNIIESFSCKFAYLHCFLVLFVSENFFPWITN